MSTWKTSRELSDKTWAVIREDPMLAAYPVKGAVFGGLVALLGIVPGVAVIAAINNAAGVVAGVLLIALGVVAGTTVGFVQLAGLVVAADAVLHGRTVTRQECMAEAKRHVNALVGWAAITVIVGTILNAVQGDGGGDNVVVVVLRIVLAGLMRVAWTLLTFFVLPVIVLEDAGPLHAVKRSATLIKERWGESIVGGFRIGLRIALMLTIPGIVLLIGGMVLAVALDNVAAFVAGGLLVVAGVGLLIAGGVLQAAARNVFGVALYRFATGEQSFGPFTAEELQGAVRTK